MTTDQNKQLHLEMIKTLVPVIQRLDEKYNPFQKICLGQKPIDEIKLKQQSEKFNEITTNMEKNGNELSNELKLMLMMGIVMKNNTCESVQ